MMMMMMMMMMEVSRLEEFVVGVVKWNDSSNFPHSRICTCPNLLCPRHYPS